MRSNHSIALLCVLTALTACGVNPVTGNRELQMTSQSAEIALGQKNYLPMRQAEGGDLDTMPEVSAYVNAIGQRLAAVARQQSGRDLPYEFTVLNNSVPNAWALPGGKIAVNRGLLTELNNESELAAVLGHEIVHAAARHGAKAQDRGTLFQGALLGGELLAVLAGVDSRTVAAASTVSGVGLQAWQMKYSREQELEADRYGMRYMKSAGYDPTGAVTLQQTFVRIANENGGKHGLFDAMFASHPPSTDRVNRNRDTLAQLGAGGTVGAERYKTNLAALMAAKPAYDKYDRATAALTKKDYAAADNFAAEACALLPTEGRFYELRGEIAVAQKQYQAALTYYRKAMQYNPNFYGSYLGAGIAQYHLGNTLAAREWLQRSNALLPTEPAQYYLGKLNGR